jgi:hypothetical protein
MIPPELNDRLWELAESQDAAAVAEFSASHPELAGELQSRIQLVSGLKHSRPPAPKRKERFMPSPKRLDGEPNRWVALAAASMLVASGVFATFGVLRFVESRGEPENPTLTSGQTTASNGSVRQGIPAPGVISAPTETVNPVGQTNPTGQGSQEPMVQAPRPYQALVTIVAKQIALSDALNDIAIQAGVKLESAPGMEDPLIEVDFRGVPLIDVLRRLGAEFEFTPSIQTPTAILLIPARDPRDPGSPGTPGTANPAPVRGGTTGSGYEPILPDPSREQESQ